MYYSFSRAPIQAAHLKALLALALLLAQVGCLGVFEADGQKTQVKQQRVAPTAPTAHAAPSAPPATAPAPTPEVSSDPYENIEQARANSEDLWQRIALGFGLGGYLGEHLSEDAQARIDKMVTWQLQSEHHLRDLCQNAKPFLYLVTELMEQAQLPTELVLLPAVESAYRPYSYSPYEAAGLWQIIPGTARYLGLQKNEWYDGRRDVYAGTLAAIKYLKRLNKSFDGDWLLTLAAYNAGPGNITRAQRENQAKGLPVDFWSLNLAPETSDYIPKFLALVKIIQDPKAHDVDFCHIGNHPQLQRVTIDGQLDLSIAAKMAGVSLQQLQHDNAALSKWATPPKGPHYLFIDHDKAEQFSAQEQKLPKDKRMVFVQHLIKPGDTVSGIAHKYHISAQTLRQQNNMRNNNLRAGKKLLIARDPDADLSIYRDMLDMDGNVVGAPINYTIKSGDSWWSIARAHHVSREELAKWNNKTTSSIIKPGQTLKIYPSNHKAQKNARQYLQKVRYKVRKGDSLSKIAKRYKVRIEDIKKWNKATLGKYLKPNMQIILYVDGRKI